MDQQERMEATLVLNLVEVCTDQLEGLFLIQKIDAAHLDFEINIDDILTFLGKVFNKNDKPPIRGVKDNVFKKDKSIGESIGEMKGFFSEAKTKAPVV